MQRASETTPADGSDLMERRCSAPPPPPRFAYHLAWRDRFADEAVPPDVDDNLTFESQPPVMRRVPASQLSLDASRVLASRALKYRAVRVTQRIVDNDKAFRHFCATMQLPPRLAQRHTPTSALSKLPNVGNDRAPACAARRVPKSKALGRSGRLLGWASRCLIAQRLTAK